MVSLSSIGRSGVRSICALLGRNGVELALKVDVAVVVPYAVTVRVQEVHIFILHFWASCIEEALTH